MTDYEELKATLESPGMKLIAKQLKAVHRGCYPKYKQAHTMQEVIELQTTQWVIDKVLPDIINALMNKHVPPKTPAKSEEWWHFWTWLAKILK